MGVPSHLLENEAVVDPPESDVECVAEESSERSPSDNSKRNYYIVRLCLTMLCMCGGYFFVSVRVSGTLKEAVASPDLGAGEVASVPGRGRVTGLLQSNDNPMVVIDGEIVRQGEQIYGVTVVNINADRVEFSGNGVEWEQAVGGQPGSGWNVQESRKGWRWQVLSTVRRPSLWVAVGVVIFVAVMGLRKKFVA